MIFRNKIANALRLLRLVKMDRNALRCFLALPEKGAVTASQFACTQTSRMSNWFPPHPPISNVSRVIYWREILEIPLTEPSAELLRTMAVERLVKLGALSAQKAMRAMRFLED
jgi:hypothetical protein